MKSSNHNRRPRKKKKRYFGLTLVLLLIALLFLFRDTFFIGGVRIALRSYFPKSESRTLTYENIECYDGIVTITGLKVCDQDYRITVDEVQIDPSFNLFSLYLEPHVFCLHPEIVINEGSSGGSSYEALAWLMPSSRCGVKLEMQNGVFHFDGADEAQRLYFAFLSGETRDKIGSFSLSYDPQLVSTMPLLFIDLQKEEEQLVAELRIQQVEVPHLVQLFTFFSPVLTKGWETLEGEIEAACRMTFDRSFALSRLSCNWQMAHLTAANVGLGIEAQAQLFRGEFTYPSPAEAHEPIWKRIVASVAIENGEFFLSEPLTKERWGLSEIDATLAFYPGSDPSFLLHGSLLQKEKKSPLHIEGHGAMHPDQSFWLEMAMKMQEEGTEAFVSLSSQEKDAYVLQTNFKNLFPVHVEMAQELLAFSSPYLREVKLSEGVLEGKATLWFDGGEVSRLQLENLQGDGVSFYARNWEIEGYLEQLQAEALIDQGQVVDLKASVRNGDVRHQRWDCKDLAMDMEIKDGAFLPSTIKGFLSEGEGKIEWKGSLEEIEAELTLSIFSDHLYKIFFGPGSFPHQRVLVTSSLKKREKEYELTGSAQFNREVLSFGWALNGGWFRSEKMTAALYAPFIHWLTPGVELAGDLDIFGTFGPKEIELSLQGSAITLRHALADLNIAAIGIKDPTLLKTEGRALFKYDREQQLLQASIPMGRTAIRKDDFTTQFESLLVDLRYDAKKKMFEITRGDGLFSLGCGDPIKVSVGTLQLSHEPALACALDLSLSDKGGEIGRVVARAQEDNLHGLHVAFDKNQTHFFGGRVNCSRLIFSEGGGLYAFEAAPELRAEQLPTYLAFVKNLGCKFPSLEELHPLKGVIYTKIAFDGPSKLMIVDAHSERLFWGNKLLGPAALSVQRSDAVWKLDKFEVDDIDARATWVAYADRIEIPAFELLWGETALRAKGIYRKEKQQLVADLQTARGDLKKIFALIGIPSKYQGVAHLEGSLYLDFSNPDEWLSGKAELKADCRLSAPLSLQIKNESKLRLAFSSERGLRLQEGCLQLKESDTSPLLGLAAWNSIEFDKSAQKWIGRGGKLSLSKALLERMASKQLVPAALKEASVQDPLALSFDFEANEQAQLIHGQLQEGAYRFGAQEIELQQILFRYDGKSFVMGAKTESPERPLLLHLQLDSGSEQLGMLRVQDTPKMEGIKCLFKIAPDSELSFEKIYGAISGVEVNLIKNTSRSGKEFDVFTGNVKADFTRAATLFPKGAQEVITALKAGRNYELSGHFILGRGAVQGVSFSGECKGKECDIMGYQFQSFHSQVQATPHALHVQNLIFSDEAGQVSIEEIHLKKDKASEHWMLEIPQAQIQNLRPSVLEHRLFADKPLKPFMIKRLVFSQIQGDLENLATLTGKGHLLFTNAYKKETSLLDLPLDMLKDLGVDVGLLTPIHGEIALELHGDKCYFTDMKNTYSEGKRSQFYLTGIDGPSYLDLKGNLHLDLAMRQDVILKLTEPFILAVRGTLEKPRYTLKK